MKLVADVGGTRARLGLVDPDGHPRDIETREHGSIEAPERRIREYLAERGEGSGVSGAVIAAAGPVSEGTVTLSNRAWTLSERGLASELGLDPRKIRIVNDFEALAWALPRLTRDDVAELGVTSTPASRVDARDTMAVFGAGTGFGVAALVPSGPDGWAAVVGEGGHATLPVTDDLEQRFAERMTRRHGRCSIERALSGSGLEELYATVAECEAGFPSEEITRLAGEDLEGPAARTMSAFWALFGTVAGDLALTLGARGGVYLAGGIASSEVDGLRRSEFRSRFEAKGRMAHYVSGVPVRVITHEAPALLGAASLL